MKNGFLSNLRANYGGATPAILLRELIYRTRGAPDGLALPPAYMMQLVSDCRWAGMFYDCGYAAINGLRRSFDDCRVDLYQCSSVLDFGCGCGRVTRHLRFMADHGISVHGSDYNRELIDWCQQNLPFAHFTLNGLAPPLAFEDCTFSLVYARSVFTHLDEELQFAWMKELRRILQPAGILYFTTQGEDMIRDVSPEGQAKFASGHLYVVNSTHSGQNSCCVWHPRVYVESQLLDPLGFELVRHWPSGWVKYSRQDSYLARRRC